MDNGARDVGRADGYEKAGLSKGKFTADSLVSLISLALIGGAGLAVNAIILRFFGPAALGIFTQVSTIYILASQFGTLGLQYSVLKHVAEHADDPTATAMVVASATPPLLVAATVVTLAVAVAATPIGWMLNSPSVTTGLLVALPAFWCLPVNKLLLNVLNGLQRNRAYSVLTALRYLAMVGAVVAMVATRTDGRWVTAALVAAELPVLVLGLALVLPVVPSGMWRRHHAWRLRHLAFGLRGMLGGAASELNTRIDVLILGLFWDDAEVGVYGFAATAVEGILQLSTLARRLLDPILARLAAAGERQHLQRLLLHGRNWGWVIMGIVAAATISGYPWLVAALTTDPAVRASQPVFAVLMGCGAVYGGYATFFGLLNQAGHPGEQTRLNLVILVVNTLLNLALAPWLGARGAATATGLSFVAGALVFRRRVSAILGLRF